GGIPGEWHLPWLVSAAFRERRDLSEVRSIRRSGSVCRSSVRARTRVGSAFPAVSGSVLVSEHSQHPYCSLFLKDLVHEPVVKVYPSGIRACKVADQFLERGRIAVWIAAKN